MTTKDLHWELDDEGIAWLAFDKADSQTNVLDEALLEAFDATLVEIAQGHPRGLVIHSAKPAGFIAGADVKAFARISEPAEAERHIRRAHEIFQRLESLAFPTVAMIHGYCLGGGLELALACDYRVAREDPGTRLGFPEVRLGIFPGFGGTVRSLRLLGHLPALDLMLTGRTVDGKRARRIGLVDHAVPERQLRNAARLLIHERPSPTRSPMLKRLLGTLPARQLLTPILRQRLQPKVNPKHYPAPYGLLEHWRRHGGNAKALYDSEAHEVSRLIVSDTAQQLIRVFLLQERLKGLGDRKAFEPRHVHVVGGGVMGGDIAAWCALRGMTVTLQDRAPDLLGRAMGRAHQLFRRKLKDRYKVREAMDRLIPDHQAFGVPRADVVIEAIFEDADAKRALYADLEPRMKPEALLATNTSSIPLEELHQDLSRPGRLIGLHFFNPVAKMPLLEVVHDEQTAPEALAQGLAFARHIDKLPLPVKSSPGFLVNRVLMPYLLEAVHLLDEGHPAPVIDRAAVAFGMPMGPIELADTVGLDICLSVARKLAPLAGDTLPDRLAEMVEAGRLGKKRGEGFYAWRKGRPVKPKVPMPKEAQLQELSDRMILRLVNESVACLREGVVEDADLLDAGVIFGTGFAPFRGGPMHYALQCGTDRCERRLHELEDHFGRQFHADPGWHELAAGH
ncbi:MAG: crotonase [Gammaproteobacteria bacterium]|nr:MAG: crotonase [Gammaproteobacteria bacterium]